MATKISIFFSYALGLISSIILLYFGFNAPWYGCAILWITATLILVFLAYLIPAAQQTWKRSNENP